MKTTTSKNQTNRTISTLSDVKDSTKAALTLKEVAEVLGLDARTISGAAANGEIPCVRIGRRVLIPRESFIEFLENKRAGDRND